MTVRLSQAPSLQSCPTLQTAACQAPLSVEFSRQGKWNGLPCPPPGNLPDPGIKPTSSAFPELQVDYSLVAQMVKHLPAMWETWVPCLGGEESLEKEMATHSSILAWEITWTEEPGRL